MELNKPKTLDVIAIQIDRLVKTDVPDNLHRAIELLVITSKIPQEDPEFTAIVDTAFQYLKQMIVEARGLTETRALALYILELRAHAVQHHP